MWLNEVEMTPEEKLALYQRIQNGSGEKIPEQKPVDKYTVARPPSSLPEKELDPTRIEPSQIADSLTIAMSPAGTKVYPYYYEKRAGVKTGKIKRNPYYNA